MDEQLRYPEVDSFLRSIIQRETGYLKDMEAYAEENHVPIIPPETAALLKVLINLNNPVRILEVGTAIGYSAIIMAREMDKQGIIDTIEINEDMAEKARMNIKNMGFSNKIRILIGDASDVLKCLSSSYDMIFIDAAKGQYTEYFKEAMRLLKNGGLLISDNVLYKGLVTNFESIPHKHRTIAVKLREYLYEICHNNMLKTSVIPIGDGMAVSIKNDEIKKGEI